MNTATETRPFFESAVEYMTPDGRVGETGGGSHDLSEAIAVMEGDARYYAERGRHIVSAHVFRCCGQCKGYGYTRRTVRGRSRREKCDVCKARNSRITVL